MGTDQQYCFTNTGGEDIYLFTLSNDKGTTVKITNFGAIITSYQLRLNDGSTNDIVLGFDKVEEYSGQTYLKQYPWFGCAVGRYANRIRNAAFELNGKEYNLSKNDGDHQLHGGKQGFDKKAWEFIKKGGSPVAFLELRSISPDGDQGFPGNLDVMIRYELNNDDELSFEYRATTDQPTPCNLTHHSYFNLDNGVGTIQEHEVRIHASQMLEQDAKLVATGKILAVDNTPYDLRTFKKIGEAQSTIEEFDKSFIVDNKNDTLQLMAEARSLKTKLQLQVWSTDPILHFYSGKWTPKVNGKNGNYYGPFSGFCMETHKHPNAVNVPHFPDTILKPGDEYFQKTVYKVKEVK